MRILLLTQWYPPEPVKILAELAETLQAQGHQVTVLTGFPNYPSGQIYPGYRLKFCQRETMNGVRVIRVPLYPDHGQSAVKRVCNYVSFALFAALIGPLVARRVDIIHVYHPPITVGFSAWVISRLWRVPFTYEIQDMWPETLCATGMLNNERILQHVEQFAAWVYKRASAIRVISEGFKSNLIAKGVPAEKIHVISNWVDADFYRPVPRDENLAQETGMAGRFNIMFAGTMGLAQGLETVLEAAELLHDCPKLQWVLVGDGVDLPRLQRLAAEKHLQNVRFLGRQPGEAMSGLYALADALLIHLRPDPLFEITVPHKTFAYMSSGRPILAAVAGDTASVVEGSQAGVTCLPGDAAVLAAAARRLYEMSSGERAKMGENGRAAALLHYGRESLVSEIAAMLQGVLRGLSSEGRQSAAQSAASGGFPK